MKSGAYQRVLCSEHTCSVWLFCHETPYTLLLISTGMEDVQVSCLHQDSGVGITDNEGKTPYPGNSDSAVQSLLCYLPRAIYSHKIFHSVRDMARKSPANPKVLQSYNNHSSAPSATKGAELLVTHMGQAVCDLFQGIRNQAKSEGLVSAYPWPFSIALELQSNVFSCFNENP